MPCALRGRIPSRIIFARWSALWLINFSKDLVPHHTNPEFAVNFIGDALLAALIRWLTEANPLPPDEYLAQVREMLDSFACILHPDHRTNRPEQSH